MLCTQRHFLWSFHKWFFQQVNSKIQGLLRSCLTLVLLSIICWFTVTHCSCEGLSCRQALCLGRSVFEVNWLGWNCFSLGFICTAAEWFLDLLESSIVPDPSISGRFCSCRVHTLNSQPCLSFKKMWALGKLPEEWRGNAESKDKSSRNKRKSKREGLGRAEVAWATLD